MWSAPRHHAGRASRIPKSLECEGFRARRLGPQLLHCDYALRRTASQAARSNPGVMRNRLHGLLRGSRVGEWATLCVLAGLTSSCTSFASVRSAQVIPGFGVDLGATASSPPGDDAAWFWTLDCADNCNHFIVSPHAGLRYGIVPDPTGPAFDIGAGISGTYSYIESYVQLARDATPFGVGVRVGIPGGWREDALFARFDKPIGSTSRLLFVPTLFRHGGNSPSGQIPGSFLAIAPGLGFFRSHEGGSYTLSLVPVLGRTNREYLNFRMAPARRVSTVTGFLVVGLTLTID